MAAGFAVLYGLFWFVTVVLDHDGRGGHAFMHFAPVVGGGLLLLEILSGSLYWRQRRSRDLLSLMLSSGSFVSILGELVAQGFVPLHGPW